jgi:predicted RNA-binding Zn-ribbon protein involved in translation (DUF1610 family)
MPYPTQESLCVSDERALRAIAHNEARACRECGSTSKPRTRRQKRPLVGTLYICRDCGFTGMAGDFGRYIP